MGMGDDFVTKQTISIPDEVWSAVGRAILATSPQCRIVPLASIISDLGVDRRDYKTMRLISRAMHMRGAETFTRSQRGFGGSYLVPDEVREAAAAREAEME